MDRDRQRCLGERTVAREAGGDKGAVERPFHGGWWTRLDLAGSEQFDSGVTLQRYRST